MDARESCPCSEWTCAKAAKGGQLEVLQWMRAEGCPWDGEAVYEAVRDAAYVTRRGEVLQWLHAEGCSWA
jgi:hypothetical protein